MRSEYERVGPEIQLRDDAVRATMVNEPSSGAEVSIRPEPADDFFTEMSGP
jgi:hypothetical protein